MIKWSRNEVGWSSLKLREKGLWPDALIWNYSHRPRFVWTAATTRKSAWYKRWTFRLTCNLRASCTLNYYTRASHITALFLISYLKTISDIVNCALNCLSLGLCLSIILIKKMPQIVRHFNFCSFKCSPNNWKIPFFSSITLDSWVVNWQLIIILQ